MGSGMLWDAELSARRGAVRSVNLIMGIYRATVTATLRDGSGQRGEDAVHRTCHISQCSCLLFITDRVHSIKHLGASKMCLDHRRVACLQPCRLDLVAVSISLA